MYDNLFISVGESASCRVFLVSSIDGRESLRILIPRAEMYRDRGRALLRALQTFSLGAILSVGSAIAHPAAAQARSQLDLGGMIEVGVERERYLRVLQIVGAVPLTPWSIQPFSPTQTRALQAHGPHPWRERFDSAAQKPGGVQILRPSVRFIENSAFPVQVGVGPTWAGRGLTAEAQAGVSAQWGAFSAQLAPLAFIAQNASFPIAPNGQVGNRQFGDARFPMNIDAPQRFGSASYGRLAAGTSSLVLDAHSFILSLSSAPPRWGPAREYSLVLGPDAGGFPSIYAGTSDPVDLWLFRAHVRVVYGQISQSAFAPPTSDDGRRLGSGVIAVALPRGMNGLEVGVARFIHRPWEGASTLTTIFRPFSGFISSNNGSTLNQGFENQLGSVFARWALPAAKAEFYGELYKEDYPGAFHVAASTLIEKPDDLAAFTLGFQRAFVSSDQTIVVVRGELVNGETSHQERGQRGFLVPYPPYVHSVELQGHTLNGLILGSAEAYGGAGWRIGVDEFSPSGRRSIGLERSLRFDWLPTLVPGAPDHPDVTYGVRAEVVRFKGEREYGVTLIPAIDLNRNLVTHNDVFNLTAAITVRGW